MQQQLSERDERRMDREQRAPACTRVSASLYGKKLDGRSHPCVNCTLYVLTRVRLGEQEGISFASRSKMQKREGCSSKRSHLV
eukprot:6200843-Pleurochrysis_carterae.AAC.2